MYLCIQKCILSENYKIFEQDLETGRKAVFDQFFWHFSQRVQITLIFTDNVHIYYAYSKMQKIKTFANHFKDIFFQACAILLLFLTVNYTWIRWDCTILDE